MNAPEWRAAAQAPRRADRAPGRSLPAGDAARPRGTAPPSPRVTARRAAPSSAPERTHQAPWATVIPPPSSALKTTSKATRWNSVAAEIEADVTVRLSFRVPGFQFDQMLVGRGQLLELYRGDLLAALGLVRMMNEREALVLPPNARDVNCLLALQLEHRQGLLAGHEPGGPVPLEGGRHHTRSRAPAILSRSDWVTVRVARSGAAAPAATY
eukprot:scaffold5708_cov378-Prasinococcus_capsulatus_cf.AAC.2